MYSANDVASLFLGLLRRSRRYDSCDRRGCPRNIHFCHIKVRDSPDALPMDGAHSDAGSQGGGDEGLGGSPSGIDVKKDDICLNFAHIKVNSGERGDLLGEKAGIRVVLGEAFDVVLQGIESGAGDNSGLSEGSAHQLTASASMVDCFLISHEDGPKGAAKTLREANGNRIDWGSQLADRVALGDLGVENARAIQVDAQLFLPSPITNFLKFREWPSGTASQVRGVLQAQETCSWKIGIWKAPCRFQRFH